MQPHDMPHTRWSFQGKAQTGWNPPDTELCRLIQGDENLYDVGCRLILEANRNGGMDNIAVVLVEIE